MEQRGDEVHVNETEASAGSKEGVVRWVLIIGLLLVAILFAVIVMTGAFSQEDGPDSEYNVSNEMAAQENAGQRDEGEPIPPAFGESEGATPDANQSPDAAPSTAATPGDAPAGHPTPPGQ
ncbi:hypothetical protein ACWPM1_05710 [Tsuneonella sp. HG249]